MSMCTVGVVVNLESSLQGSIVVCLALAELQPQQLPNVTQNRNFTLNAKQQKKNIEKSIDTAHWHRHLQPRTRQTNMLLA